MILTAKQEKFAQSVAGGMNQSDAYRAAYAAQEMKASSINVNASKMMADAKVAQRVTYLKVELESKALWTREKSVLGLSGIADDGGSKPVEIIAAIKELNSMHGFNAPTKHEVSSRVTVNVGFD
jgi:hypothetical protein